MNFIEHDTLNEKLIILFILTLEISHQSFHIIYFLFVNYFKTQTDA